MWFSKRRIYLDYASATPLAPEAAAAMRAAEKIVGNPGAIHKEGVEAARALKSARAAVASFVGVKGTEILLTSGLTEANNLAIIGRARKLERVRRGLAGTHWLVSSIEHASVLECFSEIERMGGAVSFVDPEPNGVFDPEVVASALRPETVFVSIGWANNEIGTVQPLSKIARVIREHETENASQIFFHSDAGQAPLYLSTSVHSLGVDLLSMSASKLYGPHGIAAMYVADRSALAPIILGGSQERELRAGTENVALAAGFAAALHALARGRHAEAQRVKKVRDELAHLLAQRISGVIVNGSMKHTLPHMLNISIPNVNAEYLTLALDHRGIAVSTKSACNEGEKSSHVVAALGGEKWRAENTLRCSLGRDTQPRDVLFVADTLAECISRA